MANIASARKRARQSEINRQRNVAQRSRLRTSIKSVLKAVQAGDGSVAAAAFKAAVPVIDSAVNKGHLHSNTAARHKSRLNARVKALQQ